MTAESWAVPLVAAMLRSRDLPAFRGHGTERTHGQAATRAIRMAHGLTASGIGPGDRVALLVEDRADAVEAYLAVGLAGATAVHVNDRWAASEVAEVLGLADPALLVHTAGRSDLVQHVVGARPALPVLTLGGPAVGALRHDELVASGSTTLPRVALDESSPAIVGFTSGTSGTPKGVVHTSANLRRIVAHMPVHYGLRQRSRCAFTGTLSFVAGIWGVVLPHLYLGGLVSFMAGATPDEWVGRMVDERSTFTYAPSPLVPAFAAELRRRPEALEHLEVVLHSASVLPREQAAELVDVIGHRYVETYGLTETGAPVTATVPADWRSGNDAEDMLSSAGRPASIADVRVVGPDGQDLPAGEAGELLVSSETMMAGYLGRPDLTDEVLSDGWLRTGDVGRLDAAGYVYVTDRAKDMIVSGGMNVFPAEVERVLVQVPGVAEVAVIGIPHPQWGETVAAVVVPEPGTSLTAEDLTAHARRHLAGYKKPTRVEFVDTLPRTASLKVRKEELRTWFARGSPEDG